MRSLIAIVLCLFIFSIPFKELSVYLAFKINQDYIAEYLCINRDQPAKQCNGTCSLSKSFEEQKDKEANIPFSPTEDNVQINLICETGLIQSEAILKKPNNLNSTSLLLNSKKFTLDIFHPPQA